MKGRSKDQTNPKLSDCPPPLVDKARDLGKRNSELNLVEILHLIRKLRWMGMEEEAEQVKMKLRDTTPTGGAITAARETD